MKPIVGFDHHSEEFNADPLGVQLQLQERCPVARTNAYGGHWVVSGFEEVATVLKDTDAFSSEC